MILHSGALPSLLKLLSHAKKVRRRDRRGSSVAHGGLGGTMSFYGEMKLREKFVVEFVAEEWENDGYMGAK